jgi:hypothetical protein
MSEVKFGGRILTDAEVAIALELGVFESYGTEHVKDKSMEGNIPVPRSCILHDVSIETSSVPADPEVDAIDQQLQDYADVIALQAAYVENSSAANIIGLRI